jgi:hypothetical protein
MWKMSGEWVFLHFMMVLRRDRESWFAAALDLGKVGSRRCRFELDFGNFLIILGG